MRIGILDDNAAICDVLQLATQLAGHEPTIYTEAEPLLHDVPHLDILIVDLCLPGTLQGEDIVRAAQIMRQDIPIILISATSSWEFHRRTQQLVGITILPKPFHIPDLLRAINTYENTHQHPTNSHQRQHQKASTDAHSRRSHRPLYALSESRQP